MIAIGLEILPLFLIVFLGGIFGFFSPKFGTTTVTELNKYAHYVGFPAIILNSFLSITEIPHEVVTVSLLNFAILLGVMLLLIAATSFIFKNKTLQDTYIICILFGNVAYLGFPVLLSVDAEYSAAISLNVAGYLAVLFTVGVAKLEISKNKGSLDARKLLLSIVLNPLLLATFVGISLLMLRLPIPEVVLRAVKMLSNTTSPVVVFALGIFITKNKLYKSALYHSAAITVLKMAALPLVFWVFSSYVFVDFDFFVPRVLAAMPVAITPFVLAEIYDMDKKIVVGAIAISTIIAVVWLPFVIG
jgi:predicted permease